MFQSVQWYPIINHEGFSLKLMSLRTPKPLPMDAKKVFTHTQGIPTCKIMQEL